MTYSENLTRRLRKNTALDDADVAAIAALPVHVKRLAPHATIVIEGDRPAQCCLMIEGFAVRSKTTDGGKRQILSVHIPGDIPDLQSLYLHVMDHDLKALSACTVGLIPHEALRAFTPVHINRVMKGLRRDGMLEFRKFVVTLADAEGLMDLGDFDDLYLHRGPAL